ncbi:beta-N-acetylhexosaminidase [Streptomyces sp. NPDC056944]|uniref:beta-N-acetylhexosaminidase n=1 Tax=Streptomyces sp. NPDC056944 TaxID=3345972 RepID=UPI00363D4737
MDLIPRPTSVLRRTGSFLLTPTTSLTAGPGAHGAATLLRDLLRPATGLPLAPAGVARGNAIALRVDEVAADLGAEGYRLDVSPERALLTAAAPTGLLRGVQTLRQLLPPEAWGDRPARGVRWELPCVSVRDVPRFRWRGGHLDVARWWMPLSFLFRYVDLLAAHKLNVLHLHLTDDQGWRMEIERHPRLTEVGAWRSRSMAGALAEERYDDVPHGGFYTRRELGDLVAYAARRGVTVVPEIDLPGHTQAAIAAYPELGGELSGPDERVEVSPRWGVHDRILDPGEASLDFCRDVLEEVLDVFPSPFVHIGGDEVPTTRWRASPSVRRRARELGLSVDGLHGWFTGELDAWLHARGRRTVGWDDVLVAGRARPLSEGATVMSWLGAEGALAAAAAGHEVIMTPYDWTYLDYGQAEGPGEPLSMGHVTSLEKVYAFEPVPAPLTDAQVLGTQGQLWTEYLPTPERVEYAAFPRLCALAEVAWSPPAGRDLGEFLGRLRTHLTRLDRMGVRYRPLDPRSSSASATD